MTQSEDYLRETIIIFFSNIKLIISITFVCTLIALAIAFFYPPQYQVVTSIFFTGNRIEKSPDTLETTELKVIELTREDLLSEMEMLRSYDVVENAIKKLLKKTPDFFKVEYGNIQKLTRQIQARLKAIKKLLKETPDFFKVEYGNILNIQKLTRQIQASLKTEILPKTNIIQMKLTTNEPQKGMIVIAEISNEFIQFRSRIFNPAQAEFFFEQQTIEYSKSLIENEEELIKIAKDYNSADPVREIEANLLIINNIREQMALEKIKAIEVRQFIDYLQNLLDSEEQHHFSFIDDLSIANFSEKLQGLVIEKSNLMRTFSPESVKVMRVEEQIKKTFLQLKSEVRIYLTERESKLKTLEETLTEFENQIDELSQRNVALHTQKILMSRIDRKIAILKYSHDTFSKRWEGSRISNKWKMGNLFSVRVLRKPFCSGVPTFPIKRNVIVVGLLAGFLIGCSIGFLLEFFDHTFKKPEDVQKYAGLPTIFSIPKWDI